MAKSIENWKEAHKRETKYLVIKNSFHSLMFYSINLTYIALWNPSALFVPS